MTTTTPNPGSDEAVKRGCLCPVLDNCHGKGAFAMVVTVDGPRFWIREDCPLHGRDNGRLPEPEKAE